MIAAARAVDHAFRRDGTSDEEEIDGVGPSSSNKRRKPQWKKSATKKSKQQANKKQKRLAVVIPYYNLFCSYFYIA